MIKSKIRTIPDFPKKGIMFRDVTTLFKDPEGFAETIDQLAKHLEGQEFDLIAGIEARGFILGAALAYKLKKGFVPIRKKGKLPGKTIREDYQLEYGTDSIEVHVDAISQNDKVILVDDLIATGGTAVGAVNLIRKTGGDVMLALFLVDLPELGGGLKLENVNVNYKALTAFEGH